MQRNATNTVLVGYVEAALKGLKDKMERESEPEQYRAIELLYIHGQGYGKIAQKLQCDKNTVRRLKDKMIKELSILLFGIEAFDMDLSYIIKVAAALQVAPGEAEIN